MHAGKTYSLFETLYWTRTDIFAFFLISAVPTFLYAWLGFTWIGLPWLPIALVGTAVAFLVGFKNNASYDRTWEARKIWGAIVNSSRSWALMARDFVTNDHAERPLPDDGLAVIHRRLIYRHLAWITALRYQLRKPKTWESMDVSRNVEYALKYTIPERTVSLEEAMSPFLGDEDERYVLAKGNRASHILSLQSMDLRQLKQDGYIEDFRHMEMQNMITDLFTQQGKCERIKNFPFPRQYATINLFFVWLFVLLVPFGMVNEFGKLGGLYVWAAIPFSMIVSWVFVTMEKIGEATENPFQSGPNDIPMTALTRTIEIDLRQMLEETELPSPIEPDGHILM